MPTLYCLINIAGNPSILLFTPAHIPGRHISSHKQTAAARIECRPGIDLIILRPAAKQFFIVLNRQQCCRKKDTAHAPLQTLLQIPARIHTEQSEQKPSVLFHPGVDHIVIIQQFIHILKMTDLKVKIQYRLPHCRISPSFRLFQKRIQHSMQPVQRYGKRPDTFYHPIRLTLPLQSKQFPVACIQSAADGLIHCFQLPLQLQKFLFPQAGAVHLPAPLHQIMRLIHKKQIVSPCTVRKKTPQTGMGVKHIIIITNDAVTKQACIQTHFKRADLVLLCIALQNFTGIIDLMGQHIV